MVGTEQANIKMVKMVIRTKLDKEAYVNVYSPDRPVMEYKKKVKRLVNQPLLPGYLLKLNVIYFQLLIFLIRKVVQAMGLYAMGIDPFI